MHGGAMGGGMRFGGSRFAGAHSVHAGISPRFSMFGFRDRRLFPLLMLWTALHRHMSAMDVGAVKAPTI
jgi:hypothetical protein